jgi:hypothetical protein
VAVEVAVGDLVRSYVRLRDAAGDATEDSAHLLLFYSVECGLKAAYLGKRGISARGTQDLPPELRNHDLRRLAKELRLDGSWSQSLLACRRRHTNDLMVDHQDLHQAWRYGAALNGDDEKRAVLALSGLSEWCRKSTTNDHY